MTAEIFETRREFKKAFMSGLYRCCYCLQLTINPFVCVFCGKQANGLFNNNNTYNFIIKSETSEVQKIFTPIERIKQNGVK